MNTHEPTLSSRLRAAAMERTRTTSAQVDDIVLDPDGVIDLRRLDEPEDSRSIATPPEALKATRGRLGDAGDVGHLYDDTAPAGRRWPWRGRGTTEAPADRAAPPATSRPGRPARRPAPPAVGTAPSTPRPAPAAPTPPVSPASPDDRVPTVDPTPVDLPDPGSEPATEIDLRDDTRPLARCPKCGGTGRRDLLDRISATAYFSCDACLHMWQRHEEQ